MPQGNCFRLLRSFCGGSASVFSVAATVKSDFPVVTVVNYEVKARRLHCSNLSLAGMSHSKQYKDIRRMTFALEKHTVG